MVESSYLNGIEEKNKISEDYKQLKNLLKNEKYENVTDLLVKKPNIKKYMTNLELLNVINYYENEFKNINTYLGAFLSEINSKLEKTIIKMGNKK